VGWSLHVGSDDPPLSGPGDERIDGLRSALELVPGWTAPGSALRQDCVWHPRSYLGWTVRAGTGETLGWLSPADREDWVAVAVSASEAWRFAPWRDGDGEVWLAAHPPAGDPIARWTGWWRPFGQHGEIGGTELRMRNVVTPIGVGWKLSDGRGPRARARTQRFGADTGLDGELKYYARAPSGPSHVRFDWLRAPDAPALWTLFLMYVLTAPFPRPVAP
jgi:hypothetical protein